MCGICGYTGSTERTPLLPMTAAMLHRGPDGHGEYHDQALGVHLGHRRLAVLDIDNGIQPMSNEDGSIQVVFNGEIYNHRELRAELKADGYRFRTDHSDTEVLIHGYARWGSDLVLRLNGMFAFAILDRSRFRLFLARDRFGEKPLYYSIGPSWLAFASEISSLLQHPAVGRGLDSRAAQKYFAYGYVPAPGTLISGVSKLPGGHHLTYDLQSMQASVARYWRFAVEADNDLHDEASLTEELAALLNTAVRRRLISDVPLGMFLSGGIDSSAILACATSALGRDHVKAFTIGFTDPSFDESSYASAAASYFRCRHHVKILDIGAARDLIPTVLAKLDEPFCDASLLPSYLLSEFARTQVTVALSGDGGDELFAGYDPFDALTPSRIYATLVPRGLHRGLRRLVDVLPISESNMSLDFKLRRWLAGMTYPRNIWNPVWMGPLDPQQIHAIFEQPVMADELYAEAICEWDRSSGKSILDRTLEFYTNFYLQEDVLLKADRASMMCSLESRAVFLDNDLVEFCRRLPSRFKYRRGTRKYLLKKALAGVLPRSILERKKKGFGIPLASWMKAVPERWPHKAMDGIRMSRVNDLWQAHRAGQSDHRLFLWAWLVLQSSPLLHPEQRFTQPT
jgi:asparagine synthase (glutamine-hydrolysing)